jgi:hypothetical protein
MKFLIDECLSLDLVEVAPGARLRRKLTCGLDGQSWMERLGRIRIRFR